MGLAVRVALIALTSVCGFAWAVPGGSSGASTGVPQLPRIVDARVVLGTKFGTAVRVSYCYESLPSDPLVRPARLILTVDNLRDALPPLSHGWTVTNRCATVLHPVGGIQQPYVLRYTTETQGGARSEQGLIRLAAREELARRPALPASLRARLVDHAEYGRAVRISYCFDSLPQDPSRRPDLLAVTLVSTSDPNSARGYNSRVVRHCDTVAYPLSGIPPPYVLRYVVRSKRGTYSKRGQVRVR